MKTIRKTFISACLLSLIFIFAAFAPIGVKAADATIYDISDIVEKIGARKEYEMKHGVKEVSGTALGYGDTVKFAYKERSDKNTDGHYSRTAFGIGSYGFYFYHTSGDIQVRICNMQTDARNWDRSNSYFDTIPDNTFRTYGEITFTAALKTGDENTVVLTLVYPGGKVSKEFAKQDSSDMLFRFGDHDVDGNFVKSLAPKTDNENPAEAGVNGAYIRSMISFGVNVLTLAAAFFLRDVVPFHGIAFLIGTAAGLSVMNKVLSVQQKKI